MSKYNMGSDSNKYSLLMFVVENYTLSNIQNYEECVY